MPTYEFEHIPAIDWLSRSCKSELSPKQVGSVASQLDKKIVLTETFACCGYNATPKELRSVAEVQYFNGVNKMCHHLFPYSIAGQGKFDHPPIFSSHSNWFDELREFNDYFTRLGYIIGNTEEIYDVGVIHPIRSAYLDYLREQDYASIRELEGDFNSLISDLRASGVTFQLIDESILSGHGSIENGRLKVGKNIYSTLIVPKMKNISSSTIKLLQEYTGKLCSLGNITYVDGEKKSANIVSNITLQHIKENALFKFDAADKECQLTARSGEIGEFVFVKNLSQNSDCEIKIEGLSKKYSRLNFYCGRKR